MREFKDKNDYLKYLDKDFESSLIKLAFIDELNNTIELSPYQTKKYFYVQYNANPDVLQYIKDNISDKLFNHINNYKLDLDLVDLFNIIYVIEDIELQKKFNLYNDQGKEYTRKIENLQEYLNNIIFLNMGEKNDQYRLPQSTDTTLYNLVEYFRVKNVLTLDTIRDIYEFFRPSTLDKDKQGKSKLKRRNFPRIDSVNTERIVNLNDLYGGRIIEDMMNGISVETIINDDLYSDNDFYKELKSFSFYSPKKD